MRIPHTKLIIVDSSSIPNAISYPRTRAASNDRDCEQAHQGCKLTAITSTVKFDDIVVESKHTRVTSSLLL